MKFLHHILIVTIGISLAQPLHAQMQRTMTFDASTSFMLRELNAMIVQNEEGLHVEMIMGQPSGDSNPITDELQRGDLILMMNGKRASEVSVLRETYEKLNKGDEVKIGVRRGESRFIVRAIKGDIPENVPGRMVLSIDTDDENAPTLLAELGVLVSDNNSGIQIMSVLEPMLPEELQDQEIADFKIVSINEKTFEQAQSVQAYLNSLDVGASIELEIEKNGLAKTFELTKQESRGNVRMNIDN